MLLHHTGGSLRSLTGQGYGEQGVYYSWGVELNLHMEGRFENSHVLLCVTPSPLSLDSTRLILRLFFYA